MARVAPSARLDQLVERALQVFAQTGYATAVIERSALDEPELAGLYVEVRRSIIERLTRYLESRIKRRQFRALPDAAAAGRLILEVIAWFAYHRHGDPDAAMIDDQTARATVLDFVVASLARTDASA